MTQLAFARHYEAEIETLASISRILTTNYGQEEILTAVLQELEHRVGMLRGTAMLLTADHTELVVEAAPDVPSLRRRQVRYRRGEGMIGRVLETGRSAIVPCISQEPQFTNRLHRRPREEADEASFICVPILVESEVVGTLSVDLPVLDSTQLEERCRFLGIVANMIAADFKSRRMEATRQRIMETENLRLRDALQERFRPENILGNSRAMREVYLKIHQVATADTTVLIRGEPGVGKELVATAIHYASRRAHGPLVKVDCAAISERALESELFGCEKGASNGSPLGSSGRVEEAEGGTLLLDEIGDVVPALQLKLHRLIQEREFERVGGERTLEAKVRLIATTSRNLEHDIETGAFRQDLYYRINVFPIFLSPLCHRRDDILLLADHFVAKCSERLGKSVRRISTPAINMLLAYHWPGNVRELENCMEYAVLVSDDGVIHGRNLPPTLQMPDAEIPPSDSLTARVALLEKDMIVDALKRTHGSISQSAAQLGITVRMIRYKIKKLGIDQQQFGKRSSNGDC